VASSRANPDEYLGGITHCTVASWLADRVREKSIGLRERDITQQPRWRTESAGKVGRAIDSNGAGGLGPLGIQENVTVYLIIKSLGVELADPVRVDYKERQSVFKNNDNSLGVWARGPSPRERLFMLLILTKQLCQARGLGPRVVTLI